MLTMPKPSPRVIDEIRRLPKREGDVVQLAYRGLTDIQIAESLGINRSAAYNARKRAAARLRRLVGMVDDA